MGWGSHQSLIGLLAPQATLVRDSLRCARARSMCNALAGNLSPSLTACNTRPRWPCTRWLISALFASRVLPPGVSLGTGLWVATWLLTTDHRSGWSVPWPSLDYWSPLLAIASLISLSPGPRVTLWVVHVVLCCWRYRLPMTDRITRPPVSSRELVLDEETKWSCPRSTWQVGLHHVPPHVLLL